MKNNNTSKVRIRTKLELEKRKKNFLKIVDILNKRKIVFFYKEVCYWELEEKRIL